MITIDSLKIRIPLTQVRIINPDFSIKWGEVSEVGELGATEFKHRAYTVKHKGITTRYLIQKSKTLKSETQHFVVILFNSKLLAEHYLQGIHSKNVYTVYLSIMMQEVIFVDYKDFISGFITDVDIKKDVFVDSNEQIAKHIENLKLISKSSKQKAAGYASRCNDTGMMLQYSKRDVATITHPHFKIYAKHLELMFNSNDFAYHFNLLNIEPTIRYEGTIKNKEHFNSLNQSKDVPFTLEYLITLDQSKLDTMLKSMLQKHIHLINVSSDSETEKSITLSEMLCLCLLKSTQSLNTALILIEKYGKSKDQRYSARTKLLEVDKKYITGQEKVNISNNDSLLDWVIS